MGDCMTPAIKAALENLANERHYAERYEQKPNIERHPYVGDILEQHAKLEEALRIAVEALDFASKQTVSILEGRIRLNFNGDESGPGLTFYEGETWLLGDRAKEALDQIAKILEAV